MAKILVIRFSAIGDPKKNFKVNPSLTVSTVQRVKRLIKVQSSQ